MSNAHWHPVNVPHSTEYSNRLELVAIAAQPVGYLAANSYHISNTFAYVIWHAYHTE
jgi:hypothetical protein